MCDEKRLRATVEANKDASKYGLYANGGFRTIDTYDYVDEQRFTGFKGIHVVTMVKDAKVDRNPIRNQWNHHTIVSRLLLSIPELIN